MYRIFIENDNFDKNSGDLPITPSISTKIKAISKDLANSEIEKGELVLDPENGSIHKALGKTHSKGGTPVNLKDNSFVFSNFKDLAIKSKEKEIFEFKLGGNKDKNNTPSKVLEKEVDLKHHNKMVNILQNSKKYDYLSNNSAKMMFLKNMEKAGQVAFLQESKKNTITPEFAKNTTPIYSKKTDEKISQSMQYMPLGGLSVDQKKSALLNRLKNLDGYEFVNKEGKISYFKKSGIKNSGKQMSNTDWKQFIKNNPNWRQNSKILNQFGVIEDKVNITPAQAIESDVVNSNLQLKERTSPNVNFNGVGKIKEIIDPQTYDTKLTPWQKLNLAIPFYRAATVKTQYPLRQHQESVIPQFENQNVQPLLNNNNQAYFNTSNTLRTLNPNQASSYIQQLAGNRIDANNQAIGQVQNNNIQTQNRQKELAANSLNQDAAQNRAFDLKFYDQTQMAIKNRDELKQAYEQQGIQGINETMTKKLAFDSWLNSQQQYKGKPTYIDKDGVQHYQGQSLYTPKANFFGYSTQYNPTAVDFSTYQSTSGNKIDSPEEIQSAYTKFKEIDPTFKLADFFKNKNFMQYMQTNPHQAPMQKMGGKFTPKLRPKSKLY